MYGWTNTTAEGDDGIVWKRFLGPRPEHRYRVEAAMQRTLTGRLPVATVVAEVDPWTLGTARVPGRSALEWRVHGHDLVPIYRRLGALLAQLHALDPATVDAPLEGDGPCALHGDFGAHNVVVDAEGEVAAIVDWERARRGEGVEDLAWAEWIGSTMFPVPPAALDALYEGYGRSFSADERRRGLDLALEAFRRRSTADQWPPGAAWFLPTSARSFAFPDR